MNDIAKDVEMLRVDVLAAIADGRADVAGRVDKLFRAYDAMIQKHVSTYGEECRSANETAENS